jgi:hypothetical protein
MLGKTRRHNLPNSSLIPEPAKTADMISISSKGLRGEEDFRYQRLKKAMLAEGKAEAHQIKKS